jgi:hypothetical protein
VAADIVHLPCYSFIVRGLFIQIESFDRNLFSSFGLACVLNLPSSFYIFLHPIYKVPEIIRVHLQHAYAKLSLTNLNLELEVGFSKVVVRMMYESVT